MRPIIKSVVAMGRRMNGSENAHRDAPGVVAGAGIEGVAPEDAGEPGRCSRPLRPSAEAPSRHHLRAGSNPGSRRRSRCCRPALTPDLMTALSPCVSESTSTGVHVRDRVVGVRRRRRRSPAARAEHRDGGMTTVASFVGVDEHARLDEGVRPELLVGVRHERLQAKRRRRLVDLIVDERERALADAEASRRRG